MRQQRKIRSLAISVLVGIALLAPTGDVAAGRKTKVPPEVKRFRKLSFKAYRLKEKGRLDKAIAVMEQQLALAPGNPGLLVGLARVHAEKGNTAEALHFLEKGATAGYSRSDWLREDEELEPIRDDPRFEEIVRQVEENRRLAKERSWRAHSVLDPEEAESYSDLSNLKEDFDEREASLEARQSLMGWDNYTFRRWELLDRKMAALERHLSDNPEAPDREKAGFALLKTAASYKDEWHTWGGDGPLIFETAERFLAGFPESENVPEALLLRALARCLEEPPENDPEPEEVEVGRLAEADELFAELAERYPKSSEAAKAKVWRMKLAYDREGHRVTPEISGQWEALLEKRSEDDVLMEYSWYYARRLLSQLEIDKGFEGTDLDGRVWSPERMRGKVVLVDFWATWCGPCVSEFPYLKEAYELYRDRGFEILGISLDGPDREAFGQDLEKHGIEWPQIYDGKGWQAELARRFWIWGIPTTMLLDREGQVVEIDLRGDAVVDRVGEIVGSEPRSGGYSGWWPST